MMIIPIYDNETMPCLTYPLDNTQRETQKGFGGKGITDSITSTVNVSAINDAEMEQIYDFWKTDCNFGLDPFILKAPVFGINTGHLVRFIGDISSKKENIFWSMSMNLEVLGEVVYVIDDLGNVILSDQGDFVVVNDEYLATTSNITSYKEISYG